MASSRRRSTPCPELPGRGIVHDRGSVLDHHCNLGVLRIDRMRNQQPFSAGGWTTQTASSRIRILTELLGRVLQRFLDAVATRAMT
jgi:hypothetical protein